MMMLITIDDDHDGHDDDVFLDGWGSFEASNFIGFYMFLLVYFYVPVVL